MSFLGDKIKSIIEITRKANDVFDPIINTEVLNEINELKVYIEKNMEQLKNSGDLRIFDDAQGGCLRGNVSGRKKYESGYKLLCDKKYMVYGKNNSPSEVPYMRALFNTRKVCGYDLVSYETPFMRKKSKGANCKISGRSLSCDLLGLRTKEICCIEVKIIPDNDATSLPYALLEGFSYAVCVNWLLKNDHNQLKSEIAQCCKDFGFPESLHQNSFEKATFAIAGPRKEYFSPYTTKSMKNHSKEWFNKRIKESIIIEDQIQKQYPGWFAGYMVLSQSLEDCTYLKTNDDYIVEPIFSSHCNTFASIKGLS